MEAPSPVSTTSLRKLVLTSGVLFCLTLLLLLFRIQWPQGPFFDESIYVNLARSWNQGMFTSMPHHLTTETMGRQHPPLGVYLIAAGMRVAGDGPLGWRLAGVFAGAFSIVGIFVWSQILLRDYALALTAALLTLFNNFLFVISRTVMLDGLMFLFTLWGLLAFTAAIVAEMRLFWRRGLVFASGMLFGLAAACKWNAVTSYATLFAFALALWLARGKWNGAERLRAIGVPALLGGMIAMPALTYVVMFLPLFHAMHMPFTIRGLLEVHRWMLLLTKDAPGNPTQYAAWYSWPFRISPMRALSYLVGNPVVMWGGLAAVAVCLARLRKSVGIAEVLVPMLYLANLLQWAVTPLKVPNYYYYYPAAMMLGVAIPVALKGSPLRSGAKLRLTLIVLGMALLVFLYCYPRMAHLEAPWDCMFGCWN